MALGPLACTVWTWEAGGIIAIGLLPARMLLPLALIGSRLSSSWLWPLQLPVIGTLQACTTSPVSWCTARCGIHTWRLARRHAGPEDIQLRFGKELARQGISRAGDNFNINFVVLKIQKDGKLLNPH
jgi:hypothetical protein